MVAIRTVEGISSLDLLPQYSVKEARADACPLLFKRID